MPTKRAPAQPTSIHRLKVTLLGLKPPIWRRVEVPSDYTLGQLHDVVQGVMAWDDYHLHEFRVGRASYGDPRQLDDLGGRDERKTLLSQVPPAPKSKIRYLYDFGDSWDHEILVEAVGPPDPETHYPVCIAGKYAAPPEDCGGVWGYADLLEILADPNNPEYEERLEWIGDPIDPEAFDLKQVNERLQALLKARRTG